MGNCCGGEPEEPNTSSYQKGPRKKDSFQGQVRREHSTLVVDQDIDNASDVLKLTQYNKLNHQGHRLGSADEGRAATAPLASGMYRSDINPEPVLVDPSLTDADREKIRADRAAAAEARMKKQGLNPKQKKKPSNSGEPLRGPNSEPLMRWNAAG